MALSTVKRNARDGAIVVSDSGAANTYASPCGPGDFSWSAPGTSTLRLLCRGTHATPRKQDDQVCTVGWSEYVTDASSATDATLPDICEIDRAGTFVKTNWTSTYGNASDVFAVDVEYTVSGAAFGEADVTMHFDDVVLDGSGAEGFPTTYTASGESSTLAPVIS